MDWELNETKKQLLVRVLTQQRQANCPICNTPIEKIHSHYQRTLADLSWAVIQVDLKLQTSKFFCHNQNCDRRIFTQRFPSVVAPWSRRTERLATLLTKIGLATGGLGIWVASVTKTTLRTFSQVKSTIAREASAFEILLRFLDRLCEQ